MYPTGTGIAGKIFMLQQVFLVLYNLLMITGFFTSNKLGIIVDGVRVGVEADVLTPEEVKVRETSKDTRY